MHANICVNLCEHMQKHTRGLTNIGMLFIPIENYTVCIVEVFVTGNLHIFENDNINRHMFCNIIGIGNVI